MFKKILAGMAIGAADPIPGVSGGTIAYMTGFYDQIIARSSHFFSDQQGWKENALFLLPIVLGLFSGIFVFAHIVSWLLEHFAQLTQQAFVGLVLGSLLLFIKRQQIRLTTRINIVFFIVAFLLALSLSLIPRPEWSTAIRNPSFVQAGFIFFAGFISAATMLLPGISGSMLQLMVGSYATYITAIKELNVLVLLLFFAGALLGILVMAKLISLWFERHRYLAQAAIGGLVSGSVIVLWPWSLSLSQWLGGGLLALTCASLPLLIDRMTGGH